MNIYVGNLSFRTDDQELSETFAEFGDVASAKVVIDRETDRSRGFGFVEMDNDDEAKAAIEALDGHLEFWNTKFDSIYPMAILTLR